MLYLYPEVQVVPVYDHEELQNVNPAPALLAEDIQTFTVSHALPFQYRLGAVSVFVILTKMSFQMPGAASLAVPLITVTEL
jgi:hypothetical protein